MSDQEHVHVYEGVVYRRPIGRGLTLEGTAEADGEALDLDEWFENWLDAGAGLIPENQSGRVRITVKFLGEDDPPVSRDL